MKQWLIGILVLALLVVVVTTATAEETRTGLVTSTSVSVRNSADTRAERYVSLKNGDEVTILREQGDWYVIDITKIPGLTLKEGVTEGYALKKYFKVEPYYIVLEGTVTLWADPWGSGQANGEKNSGTEMLVISESQNWLCVQCREGSAGSSFIYKGDVAYQILTKESDEAQQETTNGNTTTGTNNASGTKYVVVCDTLGVRANPNDEEACVGFLHNGDVLEVLQYGEYFTSIRYNRAGQDTECWVHSVHLQKVLE